MAAPADPETDRRFMAAALRLGRRNVGRTWPNPSVGAIVVRHTPAGPVVAGRGVTAPGGRPHGETIALAMAGEAALGATMYVSLEPCSHQGRTPPCADAIVAAGIARVVSALEDPDPRVSGRGHQRLREAGIAVSTDVLRSEALAVNIGHVTRVRLGRPHVTLKLAVSADGCIGRRGAGPIAVTGEAVRRLVHLMRAENDAILIGAGTAREDDPRLDVRLPGLEGASPVRVVLDPDARLDPDSRLVTLAAEVPTWLFIGPGVPMARLAALAARRVRAFEVPEEQAGRLNLAAVLRALAELGITRVMVEGGARIAACLLEADLVDEAVLFRSPDPIGAGGILAFDCAGPERLTGSDRFRLIETRPVGRDRLERYIRAEPLIEGQACSPAS